MTPGKLPQNRAANRQPQRTPRCAPRTAIKNVGAPLVTPRKLPQNQAANRQPQRTPRCTLAGTGFINGPLRENATNGQGYTHGTPARSLGTLRGKHVAATGGTGRLTGITVSRTGFPIRLTVFTITPSDSPPRFPHKRSRRTGSGISGAAACGSSIRPVKAYFGSSVRVISSSRTA